jgi:hypothetical protein
MATTTRVGQGEFTYSVDKRWGRAASGVAAFGLVSGIACDSQDRVYAFVRQPVAELLVLDRDGTLLNRWGNGQFVEPHGIWISPGDEVYLADSLSHLVTKWTTDGKLLQTWGTPNTPGAPGMPFNRPTRAVVTPDGEMYVSDGYGQFRVHRFGADGRLKHSWGEEGAGPGQFALPHDVWVDPRDRVMICDRENGRVQLFDRAGSYIGEWADLANPMQIFVRDDVLYLAETFQRISILTLDGQVLSRWGSKGPAIDQFTDAPHSIWVDSRGDIYVSEVTSQDKLQKFVRE